MKNLMCPFRMTIEKMNFGPKTHDECDQGQSPICIEEGCALFVANEYEAGCALAINASTNSRAFWRG